MSRVATVANFSLFFLDSQRSGDVLRRARQDVRAGLCGHTAPDGNFPGAINDHGRSVLIRLIYKKGQINEGVVQMGFTGVSSWPWTYQLSETSLVRETGMVATLEGVHVPRNERSVHVTLVSVQRTNAPRHAEF